MRPVCATALIAPCIGGRVLPETVSIFPLLLPVRCVENQARRNKRNLIDEETMSSSFRIVVPCALVLGFAAGAAQAQNFGPPDQRETWTESSRTQVWKNGFGECWHSQFGPPPPPALCGAAIAQVVPVVAPPVVAAPPPRLAPAPAVVAPPPAPAPYVAPVMPPKKDRG